MVCILLFAGFYNLNAITSITVQPTSTILHQRSRFTNCMKTGQFSYFPKTRGFRFRECNFSFLKWQRTKEIQGVPRGNVPDFGRMFLTLKCTDLTQNTYIRSWTVTEIMTREKCGRLAVPRTVPVSRVVTLHCACPSFSLTAESSTFRLHYQQMSQSELQFNTAGYSCAM